METESREYVFFVSITLKSGQIISGSFPKKTNDVNATGKSIFNSCKQKCGSDFEDGHWSYSGPAS